MDEKIKHLLKYGTVEINSFEQDESDISVTLTLDEIPIDKERPEITASITTMEILSDIQKFWHIEYIRTIHNIFDPDQEASCSLCLELKEK